MIKTNDKDLIDIRFYALGWRIIETSTTHLAYTKLFSSTAYLLLVANSNTGIPTHNDHTIILGTIDSYTNKVLSAQIFANTSSFLDNTEHSNLPATI